MTTYQDAVELINRAEVSDRAVELISLLRPSIRIRTGNLIDESTYRGSKFGGLPLVSREFEWPYWDSSDWLKSRMAFYHRLKRKNPQSAALCDESIARYEESIADPLVPLSFLAQLNLDDLARLPVPTGLPARGWLLFFQDVVNSPWGFDPASRGSWLIHYMSEATDLRLMQTPEVLEDEYSYSARKLRFAVEQTLPKDPRTYGVDVHARDKDSPYRRLIETLIDQEEPIHRIAGFPEVVQNPMELECQLVSSGIYCGDASGYSDPRVLALSPGAADWRLLLQLDSDDKVGWMWGDGGRLYYWIRQNDLDAQYFESSWCIEQCY